MTVHEPVPVSEVDSVSVGVYVVLAEVEALNDIDFDADVLTEGVRVVDAVAENVGVNVRDSDNV